MAFTEQQSKELQAAYDRTQAGAAGAATATNAGDAANLKYAMDRGWSPTPVTVPTVTDASLLGKTPPVQQPPAPVDTTNDAMASFKTAQEQYAAMQAGLSSNAEVNTLKTENTSLTQRVLDTLKGLGGKGAALQTQEAALGVPDNVKKLQELNLQIAQKSGEYDKSIETLSAGTGLTNTISGKQGQLRRQKAVEVGALTSLAQAVQGNITLAQETAKRTVDLEFEDKQNELDVLKQQLSMNYDSMDRAEKKRADEMNGILAFRQEALDKQKEEKSGVYNIMLEAAKNGADQRTLNAIRSAKSIEDAIVQAGSSLAPQANSEEDFGVIGQTTDEYGSVKNVYGFINKKNGTVRGLNGQTVSPNDSTSNQSGSPTGQTVTTSTGDVYDIGSYATDPNHETAVQGILNRIGKMDSTGQMDKYIKSVAPNSPVTGSMIASAAEKYGVSWEMMMGIMQQDSNFGTAGKATRTFNPGNVGNTDSGATVNYGSWQAGVDAVAKNLAWRKTDGSVAAPEAPKTKLKPDDARATNKEVINTDAYKAMNKGQQSLQFLNSFEELFTKTGATSAVWSPRQNAELKAKYNAAILNLKEFFNLGVLNGPDEAILRSVMPDPTSRSAALTGISLGIYKPSANTKAGLKNIKEMISQALDTNFKSLSDVYGQYDPSQVTAIKDIQNRYVAQKKVIDPKIAKLVKENPGLSNEDIIKVINP